MKTAFFWFRRDLRLQDNAGLYHALKDNSAVLPVFIFDTHILDKLQNKADARVQFIHDTLSGIKSELQQLGSDLLVRYGTPEKIWPELLQEYAVEAIYTNADYEPYAKERDAAIAQLLESKGKSLKSYKDHVIFDGSEVLKDNGDPYVVYTPYSKTWKAKLNGFYLKPYPTEIYFSNFKRFQAEPMPSLSDMGFEKTRISIPPKEVAQGTIKRYDQTRDYPAQDGTSRLGIHFRFGTVSIREKVRKALSLNEKFLNELIWRDFYQSILWHFPRVVKQSFRPEYDGILWRNKAEEFERWKNGTTGYPIVDAGMRELNTTGYMHNRVRMIVASFLTKHLLIDWRWGEAYFAEKLLDFDLASNNGGWQWAAGCGVDAAPYFRVFNPSLQQAKFDPDAKYIKKWVPEYGTAKYPKPMVDHAFARTRCLETYKAALK